MAVIHSSDDKTHNVLVDDPEEIVTVTFQGIVISIGRIDGGVAMLQKADPNTIVVFVEHNAYDEANEQVPLVVQTDQDAAVIRSRS